MGQIEPADPGLGRQCRRLRSGAVVRLPGPVSLIVPEGGFVDQQGSTLGNLDRRFGGTGVTRVDDHTSWTGRPHDICRIDAAPIDLDGLPQM